MGLAGAPAKSAANKVRVRVAYGKNMNVHVHKNRAMSRRSRELNCQRHDIGI